VDGGDDLLGVDPLQVHQLRHAHAVELAREGLPLNVIQRQLGHANLGTTSILPRDGVVVGVDDVGALAVSGHRDPGGFAVRGDGRRGRARWERADLDMLTVGRESGRT
jgi:hypothetical protein